MALWLRRRATFTGSPLLHSERKKANEMHGQGTARLVAACEVPPFVPTYLRYKFKGRKKKWRGVSARGFSRSLQGRGKGRRADEHVCTIEVTWRSSERAGGARTDAARWSVSGAGNFEAI